MIRIYRRFREEQLRSKMILQVHDELNFSVYPEEKEKVQQIVIEEMESAYSMLVPLEADYGWGKTGSKPIDKMLLRQKYGEAFSVYGIYS